MQNLQTGLDGPISLILSADARLSTPDYLNDITWQLSQVVCEPPVLALETTFGLRVRTMRIFPRFVTEDAVITNPSDFHQPPLVEQVLPNYCRLGFYPLEGLETTAEFWITDSSSLAGRVNFHNQGDLAQEFTFELAALLSPLESGQGMNIQTVHRRSILQGSAGELRLVVLMNHNPQPGGGHCPSLAVPLVLPPGEDITLAWAFTAHPEVTGALKRAAGTLKIPWEAEIARIEILNTASTLTILTGNPDWDAVLAQGQTHALRLLMPGGDHLPFTSFVSSRQPEHGYSLRGDGSDYTHLWNGQTALDTWYLATLLLPGSPKLAEGLLRNFLAVQDENGFIDGKPGPKGQRSRTMVQPLLAELAARIDACLEDHSWLEEIVPRLMKYLHAWFDPAQDRDGDGFPEWTNPIQTGLPDIPLYDRWNPGAQAVPIESLEAPGLAALLFRECRSLAMLARRIHFLNDAQWLEARADTLREALKTTWDEKARIHRYRDLVTHAFPTGQLLLEFNEPGTYTLQHSFRLPQRISLRLCSSGQTTVTARLSLRGTDANGSPLEEKISAREFTWLHGEGRVATRGVFSSLLNVEILNLAPGESGSIATVDYSCRDISQLLPLWAGIPSPRRAQAMIDRTILADFWQDYGIATCPPDDCPPKPESLAGVSMLWNQFIGEGLLAYSRRREAAELVSKLLDAAAGSLRQSHAFRSHIHAQSGQPYGEYNPISGLPPVSLFLETAGLHQICPNHVILNDFNVFPRPITVQYRGTQVILQENKSIVQFSNGQTVIINQPGFHRVSLSKQV